MKKLIIFLIFFLFCMVLLIKNEKTQMTMSNINTSNHYELIFDNDSLNLHNFKLKLGLFTSFDYNITKVYIKYNENVKDYFKNKNYFSFDSSNFNRGIENIKEEYNVVLKQNYLYEEMEKNDIEVQIEKIDLYASKDAITKFRSKYPLVTIRNIP